MTEPQRGDRRQRAGDGGHSPWSLRIASLLGIPIRIHFTFLLLLVFFGYQAVASGKTFVSGVVSIVLLFACVVLHELGHAVVARFYGVRTREIVLYPIGGVARLERMPSGQAELLIAAAGPMVNLLLAGLIFLAMLAMQIQVPGSAADLMSGDSLLLQLLFANVILLFFNLLPAFPMDGGRVLRATLTFFMSEERATTIAAFVGQGMAILFGAIGLFSQNPFLIFIAFFVFLGAGQEAAFHRSRSAVQGLTASAAMMTKFETLAPQDSLGKAADLLLATHQQDFPVIDAWGRVAGILHRGTLLEGLARVGKEAAVLDVMARQVSAVHPDTPLEEVLRILQGNPMSPVLVIGSSGLVGLINLENFSELIEVSKRTGQARRD
jgi:Zn-dependent protease